MINFTWQEAFFFPTSDTSDSLLTSFKKTISSDRVEQEDKLQRVAASQTQKGESLIIESNNEEV